jgi:hypothetical protein
MRETKRELRKIGAMQGRAAMSTIVRSYWQATAARDLRKEAPTEAGRITRRLLVRISMIFASSHEHSCQLVN